MKIHKKKRIVTIFCKI